ncbi:hypothetical protein G7B40_035220 [Aetokthonos hydrillicola Thurmond2011]|jgi:hypothetical protein|uniref:Uncharacterized protein n=1 Tax=Aetokthonos hydrillicola Thurmond2011 TaxID=2712845 RepID=A0AAP5IDS5_9CYAN|nr:hypothetical protein [Aetokthonos hydrillicola Thurmond2011]
MKVSTYISGFIATTLICSVIGSEVLATSLSNNTAQITKPSDITKDHTLIAEGTVSRTGVAIVFDPPSNIRESPNGRILCSVRRPTTINIYGSTGSWYYTDVCGTMGVIHSSQITFRAR